MSELEPVEIPALLDRAQEAWEKIEASNLGDRMLRALRLIAGGVAVREAAESQEYASPRDVHRAARRYGLLDVRTKAIVEQHRHIATLATDALEDRLLGDTKKISASQLSVISGIATDKVFKSEERSQDDGSSYLSALEQVAAQFAESGAKLELRVSIGPTRPAATESHQTIDITPRGIPE